MAVEHDQTAEPDHPLLERPPRPLTGLRRVFTDLEPVSVANGLIGVIFAATGPVAVILTVGTRGALSQADLASWIFGVFFLNGLLTVLACWLYRQPLAFFWTIPGTVLVGPALGHLGWPEVVGAFFATGLLMLVLGLTGWVRRAMSLVPMPIVMGMVAGVFLRFGTDLVRALVSGVGIAAPMVVVTGPTNALLVASGERHRHYVAGICCGLLAIVFGLFAPAFTQLMLSAPAAFVAVLAGLAMLRVLESAFVTAFRTRFTLGALVTFLVTVADVTILNIGAAFWGLLAGLVVSLLVERPDFTA